MPKTFGSNSGGGGATVGGGSGTTNTLAKFTGASEVDDAPGVTQPSGKTLFVTSQAAADEPLTLKGAALQSGNMLEVTDSADVLKTYIKSNGNIGVGTAANNNTFRSVGNQALAIGDESTIGAELGVAAGNTNVGNAFQYGWNSNAGVFGAGIDTGLGRHSAAVMKATNGSSAIHGFLGGGVAVASATALPLPTGRVFHVTGTTNITSITATNLASGVIITLIFDDVLTFTDGNNLKLAGNFVTTADDTITLAFDGTNFYEIARSIN